MKTLDQTIDALHRDIDRSHNLDDRLGKMRDRLDALLAGDYSHPAIQQAIGHLHAASAALVLAGEAMDDAANALGDQDADAMEAAQ